jgi:membrane-associated protease RseP (regulator of RpoE activity)
MKFITGLLLFLSITFCSGLLSAGQQEPAGESYRISMSNGVCTIRANKAPLKNILKAFSEKCGVELLGLQHRKNEPVTCKEFSGTPEDAVKELLRVLDENNFLLQYSNETLTKAVVVSKSTTQPVAPPTKQPPAPTTPPPKSPPAKRTMAVAVKGIVADSQAEALGLREGDIIIEYNGKRIESTVQLNKLVREVPEEDKVEMIIIRDKQPMRLTLNGGLIGVQINTIAVPEEALKAAISR